MFLVTEHSFDGCKCPRLSNLAVNKQERKVKAYIFVGKRQAWNNTRAPTATTGKYKGANSDHKQGQEHQEQPRTSKQMRNNGQTTSPRQQQQAETR